MSSEPDGCRRAAGSGRRSRRGRANAARPTQARRPRWANISSPSAPRYRPTRPRVYRRTAEKLESHSRPDSHLQKLWVTPARTDDRIEKLRVEQTIGTAPATGSSRPRYAQCQKECGAAGIEPAEDFDRSPRRFRTQQRGELVG